mgnify:CR=1 FL=1|tara:strand:+ start:437 stop:961 length:525 start_codon:yes stop_codon:yes gene_type:complete
MKIKKFLFKKVRSTNDTSLRLIRKNYKNGFVISEVQTAGKGQRGKKWISNKGNIFLSIFFIINPNKNLVKITNLTLNIVNKIINKYSQIKTTIKKPNDILINKQKVSGILQEVIFYKNKKFLIVGIGINLLNSPNIKDYPTTYLYKYSKKKIYKIELTNKIKNEFEKQYYKFIK